jgi:tRNA(Glu) U13 pseudouridine synthase TruD
VSEQPPPTPNEQPTIWNIVIADMSHRNFIGTQRYGTPLQPFNGRDALKDAYEEALDLAVYLRQAIYERDGK